MHNIDKATGDDFKGRFREIISDPINILVERHPLSGCVTDEKVYLHNGLLVPLTGPNSYYGNFSDILVINRGVHEPLEEFVFQQLLKRVGDHPRMLELGAYWGHYSMWMKSKHHDAEVVLVESEEANIESGRENFRSNGFQASFIRDFVGKGLFEVDKWLADNGGNPMTILHSDIQGYESEMLEGASRSLDTKAINYFLVSTHSQQLHSDVIEKLTKKGYLIDVSSDFETESTSHDGFILASSPTAPRIFEDFHPWSRVRICNSSPRELIEYLKGMKMLLL
jgi:hypothetical protein